MPYDTALARVASRYPRAGRQPLTRAQAALVLVLEGRRIVAYSDIAERTEQLTGTACEGERLRHQIKRLRARGFSFRTHYGIGIEMTGTPRERYCPDEAARARVLAREIAERLAELEPLIERMCEK